MPARLTVSTDGPGPLGPTHPVWARDECVSFGWSLPQSSSPGLGRTAAGQASPSSLPTLRTGRSTPTGASRRLPADGLLALLAAFVRAVLSVGHGHADGLEDACCSPHRVLAGVVPMPVVAAVNLGVPLLDQEVVGPREEFHVVECRAPDALHVERLGLGHHLARVEEFPGTLSAPGRAATRCLPFCVATI